MLPAASRSTPLSPTRPTNPGCCRRWGSLEASVPDPTREGPPTALHCAPSLEIRGNIGRPNLKVVEKRPNVR